MKSHFLDESSYLISNNGSAITRPLPLRRRLNRDNENTHTCVCTSSTTRSRITIDRIADQNCRLNDQFSKAAAIQSLSLPKVVCRVQIVTPCSGIHRAAAAAAVWTI